MISELLTNSPHASNSVPRYSRQEVPLCCNKHRTERCFTLMCFGDAQVCYLTAFYMVFVQG